MLKKGQPGWKSILAALIIADITASFEAMMVYSTLRDLYLTFNDTAGVGWLITAYLLVGAAAAAVCGRLGDLYGRKRMMVIILSLATVGSILSASSTALGGVIAGRAMQGLTAAVLPLCFGALRKHVPFNRVSLAGGILMSSASIGAISGLVIGGLIVDSMNWRVVFWLSALFGVLAVLLVMALLPNDKPEGGLAGLDIFGGVLFAPAIAGLLFAVSKLGQWGLTDPRILLVCLASTGLFIWWIRHELNHRQPLIDVRLLARRDIALTNLSMLFLAFGALQLTMIMMLLLQQNPITGIGLGMAAAAAGLFKVPGNVASVLISPVAGQFCKDGGEQRVILTGFILNIVAWSTLIFFHQQIWMVFGVVVLSTLGTTLCFVGSANHITAIAPADRTSEANGVTMAIRSIGASCGAQTFTLLLGAAVMSEKAGESGGLSALSAYQITFVAIVALSVCGLLFVLMLGRRPSLPAAEAL